MAVKLKFRSTELPELSLKCTVNPLPVMLESSKKSPEAILKAVIPIAGGLEFAPNNALVPVKKGELKVIDFAPAPEAIVVVLCSVLL